jgi:hypothetical protein
MSETWLIDWIMFSIGLGVLLWVVQQLGNWRNRQMKYSAMVWTETASGNRQGLQIERSNDREKLILWCKTQIERAEREKLSDSTRVFGNVAEVRSGKMIYDNPGRVAEVRANGQASDTSDD